MNETIENLVHYYHPSTQEITSILDVPTDILTGITGAGKDTIISDILRKAPGHYERVITSTTRSPRANNGVMEREGESYYFLSFDQAREKMENGEYIEVAKVHDNIYGSLFSEYRRIAGLHKFAIGDIDYQGAINFLDFGMSQFSLYFIVPPNFETWAARLAKRSGRPLGRDDDTIGRLHSAQKELTNALANEKFIPLINDVSSETAQRIIEYRQTGTHPTEQEVTYSRELIRSLDRSITNYVTQIKD